MKRFSILGLALVLAIATGCTKPVATLPQPTSPTQTNLPLIPHPEYANWSSFPVGTKVVRKDSLASENGDVFLYTTLRLSELSESSIVVETQTAIERAGERQQSDLNTVDYPAEFRLPKGMTIEQFQLPAIKAEKIGNETMSVDGVNYDVEVFTYVDQSEAGPVDVKTWRSNAIPGRQAKKQIVDGNGLVLSSSITEKISIP